MKRRLATIAVLGVSVVGAFWVVSTITSAEERNVIKVENHPDGSLDVYLAQPGGGTLVEHHEANGEIWFESDEVLGPEGEPVICPNGKPLRISLTGAVKAPSPAEAAEANQGLPDGKMAVFNEYTGQFELVDGGTFELEATQAIVKEPLVYRCGAGNVPALVPLSDVDPEAAAAAQRDLENQVRGSRDVTGLGSDPARSVPLP